IIPFTVMDIFNRLPGMPGLFLASLFSASLSTLSSGLSSLSALLWTDVIKPRIGDVSEFKATFIAKISVVMFGLLGCGVAILVSLVGGPMTQVAASLSAGFAGPLTGLFLLGCFCPQANAKGTLIGGVLSLILSTWLSMGKSFSKSVKKLPWLDPASTAMCDANSTVSDALAAMMELTTSASGYTDTMMNSSVLYQGHDQGYGSYYTGHDLAFTSVGQPSFVPTTPAAVSAAQDDEPQGIDIVYTLSYMWLAPVGIILTLVLGNIFSLLTGGNKPGEVNPRYLISFFDRLCCFLPECILSRLRVDDYTTATV
ncbi:hypothetical protein BaRGS_00028184, partial [Batillaria attramentaria]